MKIKKARKVIRKAFEKDPDFKETYVANVAMKLYDTFADSDTMSGLRNVDSDVDQAMRNQLATEIIDLIFGK